jgi:hypothetical protein
MPLTTCECCENRYSGGRTALGDEETIFLVLCFAVSFGLDNIRVGGFIEFIECEFRKNQLEENRTLLKGGNKYTPVL